MTDKRYTLAEADKIRRLDSCRNHGHSWEVIANYQDGPLRIVCDTCGWSGSVHMGERPTRPEGNE